jgi:hypothetical protein
MAIYVITARNTLTAFLLAVDLQISEFIVFQVEGVGRIVFII